MLCPYLSGLRVVLRGLVDIEKGGSLSLTAFRWSVTLGGSLFCGVFSGGIASKLGAFASGLWLVLGFPGSVDFGLPIVSFGLS